MRQQAITWASADPDFCPYDATRPHWVKVDGVVLRAIVFCKMLDVNKCIENALWHIIICSVTVIYFMRVLVWMWASVFICGIVSSWPMRNDFAYITSSLMTNMIPAIDKKDPVTLWHVSVVWIIICIWAECSSYTQARGGSSDSCYSAGILCYTANQST